MTDHAILLTPEDYRSTPWKNGGGVSLDIASAHEPGAAPESFDGMLWRFGRTSILQPGPFSDLAGFERLQLVLNGSGLVLQTPDGEIDLREALQPVRYDGGLPVTTRLENGPVEVINLIADREQCDIDMRVLKAGNGAVALPAGASILYTPDAPSAVRAGGRRFELATGHALRCDHAAPLQVTVEEGFVVAACIALRAHRL